MNYCFRLRRYFLYLFLKMFFDFDWVMMSGRLLQRVVPVVVGKCSLYLVRHKGLYFSVVFLFLWNLEMISVFKAVSRQEGSCAWWISHIRLPRLRLMVCSKFSRFKLWNSGWVCASYLLKVIILIAFFMLIAIGSIIVVDVQVQIFIQ